MYTLNLMSNYLVNENADVIVKYTNIYIAVNKSSKSRVYYFLVYFFFRYFAGLKYRIQCVYHYTCSLLEQHSKLNFRSLS